MFSLMTACYENVQQEKFLNDLTEKDGVLMLYDEHHRIQGFTTFLMLETSFQNRLVHTLYSGDTVVDQHFWGRLELFKVFGGLFKKCLLEKREPLYWLLLTKGVKSYCLLPLFFTTFYPNHYSETPAYEQQLIDHLAGEKFDQFYVKNQGIVRVVPKADRLTKSLLSRPDNKRNTLHGQFFMERNPGYIDGDELVCLARISSANFTYIAQRFVKL
jgi:hypothetical protein